MVSDMVVRPACRWLAMATLGGEVYKAVVHGEEGATDEPTADGPREDEPQDANGEAGLAADDEAGQSSERGSRQSVTRRIVTRSRWCGQEGEGAEEPEEPEEGSEVDEADQDADESVAAYRQPKLSIADIAATEMQGREYGSMTTIRAASAFQARTARYCYRYCQ